MGHDEKRLERSTSELEIRRQCSQPWTELGQKFNRGTRKDDRKDGGVRKG